MADMAAFNAAWKTSFASFAVAAEQPMTVTTRAVADDMAEFLPPFPRGSL